MERRHRYLKLLATILLCAGILAAGGLLAWRLYNHFSYEKIQTNSKTVLASLQQQAGNPYVYDADNRALTVSMSPETIALFLRDACTNERVLEIQAVDVNAISLLVQNQEEKLLIFASYVCEQHGNVLRFELSDLRLGTSKLGYNLSALSQELKTIEFNLSGIIPEWTSLQKADFEADGAEFVFNIALSGFRDALQKYLCHADELLQFLGSETVSRDYLNDCKNYSVSRELAELVLCGLFEDGSARQDLCATVAVFDEPTYQDVLSVVQKNLSQSRVAEQIKQYRLQLKTQACELVAKHYFELLQNEFESSSMHASVFYPFNYQNGKIYDRDWIEANKPENLLYTPYCDVRPYYNEASGQLALFITVPNETKVYWTDGVNQKTLTEQEANEYPLWKVNSDSVVAIEKASQFADFETIVRLICDERQAEHIYVHYLSFSSSEAFVVYSVDATLALHGSYLLQTKGKWEIKVLEVGLYEDFAKTHPEINYMLFPEETYYGRALTRLSNSDLDSVLYELMLAGDLMQGDYFDYYSCLDSIVFYRSHFGRTGVYALEKGTPGVFTEVLEDDHE